MKYLLSLLLLLTGIANAGQEPPKEPEFQQVYLFILMNGRGQAIKPYNSPYPSLEACHEAIETSKHKGHTKAFVWCGTELFKNSVVTTRRLKTDPK